MRKIKDGAAATGGETQLKKYLSPLGVWALAFGCSVGWGSFVMPGTTFLPIAGPVGTAIGMLVGAAVMFVIGVNYHFLMNRNSDAGGAYAYAKKSFGYDHGFLCAWFLLLTYIAILWANATALSIFSRTLFGDFFKFGFHYTVAGYDVYFGEVLLSVAAIVVFGLVCAAGGKVAKWTQIVFAFALLGGITVCFIAALIKNEGSLPAFSPAFGGEGNPASQVFAIAALAPWAFVGFESISHSSAEFNFRKRKTLAIIIFALLAGTLAYVLLNFTAVAALPEGFAGRAEYLAASGNMSGTHGLPTFYAAETTLGVVGVAILGIAAFAGIATGIVATFSASSRLAYSLSEDGIIPSFFGKLNKNGVPANAICVIALISFVIPFFGRTAIGWIVDVTTIGASIAYAYASLAAWKSAREEKKTSVEITGIIGFAISAAFAFYLLIPDIGAASSLTTASYLILVTWSIIGIIFIRFLISADKMRRLGKTSVVWIALLVLIFLVSLMWARSSTNNRTKEAIDDVTAKYEQTMNDLGLDPDDETARAAENYASDKMRALNAAFLGDGVVQMGIILVSLVIILSIFSVVRKREIKSEEEKLLAEKRSNAKSVFLSNMSHDIRTPMNAITGYSDLALKEPDLPPKARKYVEKIDYSSKYLLSLINDILDMSRIESGKMELITAPCDITVTMDKVREIFSEQMEQKNIAYTVEIPKIFDKKVILDENRLMRILLNLVSNAFKFTPEGGRVSVVLVQTGFDDGKALYEIRVKDNGIGMSEEFAARVFEAFERERNNTVNKTQGTGLGMAITKSFVDMMGGNIEVVTKQDEGTEFIISLGFPVAEEDKSEESAETAKETDFTGKRFLVVDDNAVNREIACLVLAGAGIETDTAENGKEAVEKVKAAEAGEYDVILMDVQMPVMNGYEATREIRSIGGEKGNIPVLAMTANVFSEDIKEAENAGMNGHIAKPIDVEKMFETLRKVLK